MDYTNIVIAISASIGSIYTLKKLVFGKIDKQFEKIDKRFEKIEIELYEIRKDIRVLDKRVDRLENRLEFSNKIVYVQHQELTKK